MEHWEKPCVITLRIKNPKTLKKWLNNGNFRREIDKGYLFHVGCGRFRKDNCSCYDCRTNKNNVLQKIIDTHYINK